MSNCNAVIQIVPGPQGLPGTNGTNGTDGADDFTVLTAEFTMPIGGNPAGPSATATVESTAAFFSGQIFQMEVAGYLEVDTIINSTQMTLHNLQEFAPGLYPDNVAAGSIIPIGAKLTPSGPQGIDGATGANGTNGTNGSASYTTLSLDFTMPAGGATAIANLVSSDGLVIGNVVYVETLGHLEVTAIGSAVTATLLNLEVAGAYASNAVAGTIAPIGSRVNVAGLQGPTGPTGATGPAGPAGPTGSLNYALYQEILPANTHGGTFSNGALRTVPLNTEVSDASGIATIAGNQVTITNAGTYRAKWRICAYQVGEFVSQLTNITDTLAYQSSNADAIVAGGNTYAFGEARFTLAAGAKVFALQAQCVLTVANNGFGNRYDIAVLPVYGNVYASLELWKE